MSRKPTTGSDRLAMERHLKHMLNEQHQEIAELKKQLKEKDKEIDEFKRIGEKGHLNDLLEDQRKENRILIKASEQLLQRLENQPAEIVEKIREPINQLEYGILKRYKENTVVSEWDSMKLECYDQTLKILDKILKEYGGEE